MTFKPTHTIIRTNIDVMFCCVDFTSDLIEVKSEKGRLSEIQKYRIEELKAAGFAVDVMKPC